MRETNEFLGRTSICPCTIKKECKFEFTQGYFKEELNEAVGRSFWDY